NRQGEYNWHYVQGEPIRNEQGTIIKWIGSFTNIQYQKNITAHLEKVVEERTRELQRSNEDLQQFAHVASHDLKEPVRKIMVFNSLLREELRQVLSGKADTWLSKIEHAAQRMNAMIDGVLLYSTVNSMDQTRIPIDLNELMQQVETDLEVMISQKHAMVRYKELPLVSGLPLLIYQLFYNLVNNSLKFSRKDVSPVITVRDEQPGEDDIAAHRLSDHLSYIKIVVEDNGIGISEEDAARIFGAFTRLHSKDQFEGTGLGLALCKKIAERHGGAIWAEHRGQEGAMFCILLPAG
ncbi:MAG: PAS domain-containing sensor histidine kinase, partial [Sphingobacteriales bacterium]